MLSRRVAATLRPRARAPAEAFCRRASSSASDAETKAAGGASSLMSGKNNDKLTHLVLSGFLLYLSMRLVSQAHKAEDAEALMHAQLADARDQQLRRRRAILERAPELASQAGLRPDGVRKFRASLEALDVQLEAEVSGPGAPTPALADPRPPPAATAAKKTQIW
mmetsp:Transcript_88657/g.266723  ORF Transcript_88657/g.266723 Transcript_88657/m.266723 type:complete len:165 (-) Transcript_88657:217-711(-)